MKSKQELAKLWKHVEKNDPLALFLKRANCKKEWKLQVYNAVIISKLIYGLETMYLNESQLKRLDAFHIRGLRHILGITHSYWSRAKNSEILDEANEIDGKREDITSNWREFIRPNNENQTKEKNKIRLVSEILREKRKRLLGHMM